MPMGDISKQAIEAALSCNWQEAINLNKEILKKDSQNIDTLNRLGRAYFELGNIPLAKKYYSQTLKFDAYNPIATKNLKIIKTFNGKSTEKIKPTDFGKITPSLFIQEPGQTKVVSLLKVAEPKKLSRTSCGMPVQIISKNRHLIILDQQEEYLGVLPDDLAHHISLLIKGGNKYMAFVKSIRDNGLTVIIHETFRAAKFKNQPSFPEYHTPETKLKEKETNSDIEE